MTRLITDDLESGSGTWDSSTSASVVTAPVAHGTYAVRLGSYGQARWLSLTLTEAYTRFYFMTDDHSNLYMITGMKASATMVANLRRDGSTKKLRYYLANTLKQTGSIDIEPGTWYLIETYFLEASSGGRYVVKVNGVTDIDYTGDTKGPYGNCTEFNVGKYDVGIIYHYFDDIAVNDPNGGSDDSWIGNYPGINLLKTFEGMTLAGTGTVPTSATLDKTLGNMTVAGTADIVVSGDLDKSFENMTVSGSTETFITASLSKTFENMFTASRSLNSAGKRSSALQYLKPYMIVGVLPDNYISSEDRAHVLGYYSLVVDNLQINASLTIIFDDFVLDGLILAREGRVWGPAIQAG